MSRLHRTEIQVRFADTDMLGHLNNAAYAAYAEHSRLAFFRDLDAGVGGLILAHLALDFRRQVRFGETVLVTTEVIRIGNSSVRLRQLVYADGEVACDIESVVVLFDYRTQRSRNIPEEMRARLEPFSA